MGVWYYPLFTSVRCAREYRHRHREAVADSKGVESNESEIVLTEHVDLEAVERLAENSDATRRPSFTPPQHRVTIANSGEILVDDRAAPDGVVA